MPILHDVLQYSAEYDRLKCGMPTSSQFHKIVTPGGAKHKPKASVQWKSYAYQLLAERLLGRRIDSYMSPNMERGLLLEAEAVRWYEWEYGVETRPIGFITTDDGRIGCSPDRLVGDDGLAEIKCPIATTQVQYLIEGKIDQSYFPQIQGQLYVSGRRWVDLISYYYEPNAKTELPKIRIRVERDEEFIAFLALELGLFLDYIEGVMVQIGKTTARGVPKMVPELADNEDAPDRLGGSPNPERADIVDPQLKPPEAAAGESLTGAGSCSEMEARQSDAADRRSGPRLLNAVSAERQGTLGENAKQGSGWKPRTIRTSSAEPRRRC
jgi:hypothetical protein